MIKNDVWIRDMAAQGMITPFTPTLIREIEEPLDDDDTTTPLIRRVLSYGLSSYGYDLRLDYDAPGEEIGPGDGKFQIFRHIPGTIVDPKRFNRQNLENAELHVDRNGDMYYILPGRSYALGVAMERLEIPANITCIFIGKSTYARCGIIVNTTPGEAQWKGFLTIEISNSSAADCRIYVNEGIVQTLFFEGEPCATTYDERQGKYQNQPRQIVLARV